MKPIFKDYVAIYKKFLPQNYLTREERKQRYDALQKYAQNNYEIASIEEFTEFMSSYANEIIVTPQFSKQIAPILGRDIENGGVLALKYLAEEYQNNNYYSTKINEYLPYDYFEIANLLLQREMDNELALKMKYKALETRIGYSIHEVPWGILFGNHGANIEETKELLQELADFEEVSKKLARDSEELITEAKFYYNSWLDYLERKPEFKNFVDYFENIHNLNF